MVIRSMTAQGWRLMEKGSAPPLKSDTTGKNPRSRETQHRAVVVRLRRSAKFSRRIVPLVPALPIRAGDKWMFLGKPSAFWAGTHFDDAKSGC